MTTLKNSVLLLAGTLLLGACGPQEQQHNNDAAADLLHNTVDRYFEEKMEIFPIDATFNGEHQFDNLLHMEISEGFRQHIDSFASRYLAELDKVDTAALSPNDRISYDIARWELNIMKEGLTFHDHLMPINQFASLTLTLPQLGSGTSAQPFKTKEDYEKFMQRMKSFSQWADSAIANMRRGEASGYVLPKALVVKVIPQLAALTKKDSNNVFYGPLKQLPEGLDSSARNSLSTEYKQAIESSIIPAFEKLRSFMQTEYLPKARSSSGIGALPDGKAYYQYLIRFWTTTNKTPEEIFATGEKEVARIRGEMEEVKNSTGFKGDLAAFFTFVRNDPQFKIFKTPAQVLDSFKAIENKIMPGVQQMYLHLPKTKFEIRQTEAYRAASASAEYFPGSVKDGRPGVFYVPILDAKKFSYVGMESLFLHEAIPGHHFQSSLQQENDSLPKLRKFIWFGAYGEGYALYCEGLGKELGLYTNPYQYFGRLSDEIHRAIRLVVDVGMHAKGWTREQALKYMLDNEPLSEEEATAEIERYMALPGQALSYKTGELKIRELRQKYEQQLGNQFSLKDFHDELLKDGCVPLSVLEAKMQRRFGK
ncbi:MAG TPA: DUF885 domain-containing protein [Chitinophaga sp.]